MESVIVGILSRKTHSGFGLGGGGGGRGGGFDSLHSGQVREHAKGSLELEFKNVSLVVIINVIVNVIVIVISIVIVLDVVVNVVVRVVDFGPSTDRAFFPRDTDVIVWILADRVPVPIPVAVGVGVTVAVAVAVAVCVPTLAGLADPVEHPEGIPLVVLRQRP
eukprot:CAMPEP_0172384786 /NCGR_PEP_ID=MMETSP1061-20121228/2527_1 /TAXON_ID=37318 /ORGANISM="Pseudo-nitzschia pungens, Strain cf. pungens" /LENGTH=162 /DNA_ID=CAMNT_0013113559 /DNA_START=223 /DNA_END=708 /DNA_ORIENTATION=+